MNTKELSKYIHMTFEVAEYLQPSVIYIDQIEKVLTASKKKAVGGK